MNEQIKKDRKIVKDLSTRFIKAYTDHEFKLFLAAQARVERARAVEIVSLWFEQEMEDNRRSRLIYEHLAEANKSIIKQILSDNN